MKNKNLCAFAFAITVFSVSTTNAQQKSKSETAELKADTIRKVFKVQVQPPNGSGSPDATSEKKQTSKQSEADQETQQAPAPVRISPDVSPASEEKPAPESSTLPAEPRKKPAKKDLKFI